MASPFHPNLIGATLCRLRRYQSPGVLSVQIDKPTIKSIVNEVIDEHPTIQRMANKIGDLDTRIGDLDTRIGGLDTRIGGLDTRVGRLETDVSELKSELKVHARTTNYSINQLHNSVHKLNLTMDDMKSDIKKVLEIVIPSKKREEQFDQMEHRVEDHAINGVGHLL